MTKFLPFNRLIDSSEIVGFDMDGTLYDEFDFIRQVYVPIAAVLGDDNNSSLESRLQFMLNRWSEKGSSYPLIFEETLERENVPKEFWPEKISTSLKVFRTFVPTLNLSASMQQILEYCNTDKELFLVSDGSSVLQWNKFNALGLNRYFRTENVFISGDHGIATQKPSLASLNAVNVLKKKTEKDRVVFIGDRVQDEIYAKDAGFKFIHIKKLFENND